MEVKICGITDFETLEVCKEVEFLGLVFYQKSPRFIDAFRAKEISNFITKNQIKVGLFVNSDVNLIKHISEYVNLDMIQLHGDESFSEVKFIKNEVKKPIIKAIPIADNKDIELSRKYEDICDMILFDKKSSKSGLRGGTGQSFDWSLLKNFDSKKKWMLAGGINIGNVKNAILQTNPPILDISSGVEKKKGVKCKKKITNFLNYLKKNEFN